MSRTGTGTGGMFFKVLKGCYPVATVTNYRVKPLCGRLLFLFNSSYRYLDLKRNV